MVYMFTVTPRDCTLVLSFIHDLFLNIFVIVPLFLFFGPSVGLAQKENCYVNSSISTAIYRDGAYLQVKKRQKHEYLFVNNASMSAYLWYSFYLIVPIACQTRLKP